LDYKILIYKIKFIKLYPYRSSVTAKIIKHLKGYTSKGITVNIAH